MQIPEPRMPSDLEDPNGVVPKNEWHAKALRVLAMQLGVPNDFFYPLLGAAQLLDGQRSSLNAPTTEGDLL